MKSLKKYIQSFEETAYALYLASKSPKVPRPVKIYLSFLVGYILSPLDLIPDFIPILGLLDDLILIPAAVFIAVRLIPKNVWEECKRKAKKEVYKMAHHKKGTAVIIGLWLLIIFVFIFSGWEIIKHMS